MHAPWCIFILVLSFIFCNHIWDMSFLILIQVSKLHLLTHKFMETQLRDYKATRKTCIIFLYMVIQLKEPLQSYVCHGNKTHTIKYWVHNLRQYIWHLISTPYTPFYHCYWGSHQDDMTTGWPANWTQAIGGPHFSPVHEMFCPLFAELELFSRMQS